MAKTTVLRGFGIVVLDRGFVYVGEIEHDGEWCVIKNARCLRKWGTTNGLAELSLGPTPTTELDAPCTVRAPGRAVIHIVEAEVSKWNAS